MKWVTKTENIISFFLGISGVVLFTFLLIRKDIGSISYSSLLAILALTCLAISWGSRIRELNLKDLKIILGKHKKIKEDIYAKEEKLKQISVLLSEIIAFNTSTQNRWTSINSVVLRRNWNRKKIDELLKLLNVPETEKEKVFKYSDIYDRIDKSEDVNERSELSNKLHRTLEDDCSDT